MFHREFTFFIELLQTFKGIVGILSVYSIRTLQLIGQEEDPLKTLLSNFEENHFSASLLPEQDSRVELYTMIWQHERNRDGEFAEYLEHNDKELNDFITSTRAKYEEENSCTLYDAIRDTNFDLPRSLTQEEINHLPLQVIRTRLLQLQREQKLLKRQKREKTKNLDAGEQSPRLRGSFGNETGEKLGTANFLSPRRKHGSLSHRSQQGIVSSFFHDRLKSKSNPRNSISVTHSIGM